MTYFVTYVDDAFESKQATFTDINSVRRDNRYNSMMRRRTDNGAADEDESPRTARRVGFDRARRAPPPGGGRLVWRALVR